MLGLDYTPGMGLPSLDEEAKSLSTIERLFQRIWSWYNDWD